MLGSSVTQPATSSPPRFLPQVMTAATANVAGAVGAACAGLLVARALGPAGRGVVAGSLAWAGVAGLITSLGLVHAMTYFVARARSATWAILRTASVYSLPPSVAIAVIGSSVAYLRMDGADALTYACAFWTIPLFVAGGLYTGALQALKTSSWNAARLSQQAVYLVAVALVFGVGRLSLTLVAFIILGSVASQLLLARWLVGRAMAEPEPGEVGDASAPPPKDLLSYGFRNLVAAIPSTVNARLDQAVLAVAASRAQLGAYAVAVSLSLLGGPVVAAFGNIAFPRIAAMNKEVDRRAMERLAFVGTLAVSGLLAAATFVTAPRLVSLLFGPEFTDAVPLIRILAPAGVALSANLVLADLLRARGRPEDAAKAEGLAAVVTAGLLVIFAPRYGAAAAAWTSLVAYSLASILLVRRLRLARA